ncbi:MAG TPA: hypothetical protein VN035_05535 [Microbacterium sp.]|nr:hypothetical protein [Microbacterium sp.]
MLPIADRLPSTEIGLARPHGAPLTPRYRALRDFLAPERPWQAADS